MLLLAPLALLALSQEPGPILSTPFDRVIELEITQDDEPAIEGHGPTAVVEYEIEFDGQLSIWPESDLDLFLRVDDASEARLLASSGGTSEATTPYINLKVSVGDWIVVLAAGKPAATGSLTLHLMASPETDAGHRAEQFAQGVLEEFQRLLSSGRSADARELISNALAQLLRADAPAQRGQLRACAELAFLLYELRDFTGAKALNERVHAAYARILPDDHPALISVRQNLAVSMQELGDFSGALTLHETVLAGLERTLPNDNPELLLHRQNLVSTMRRLGDLSRARALQESILSSLERNLPQDDIDLVVTRGNLAILLDETGDLAGARALRESVLAALERTLPEDHSQIRRARTNLAISMEEMGDFPSARATKETVLESCERNLPEDHPELLRARHNLANSLHQMGAYVGAAALRQSVVDGFERTRPEDDPLLLDAYLGLANSRRELGDFAGALTIRASVLAVRERTLPDSHPDLLHARFLLASSLHDTGQLVGAHALLESVLASRECILPEGHPGIDHTRYVLALYTYELGDIAQAHNLIAKAVPGIKRRVLDSLALAPRQALQAVASESNRISGLLSIGEAAGLESDWMIFELLETMRLVATEAPRSLLRFRLEPELARLLAAAGEVRKNLAALVVGLEADDAERSADPTRIANLSLRRDQLEREATRRLAAQGVTIAPVQAEALIAALGPGDAAIGFRWATRMSSDRESRMKGGSADHVWAHVVTSDGRLTRVNLGRATEIEDLTTAWRATLQTPRLPGESVETGRDAEWNTGTRLRRAVLDPLLEVAGEDVKRLFICADASLFLLPLDALPVEADESRSLESAVRHPIRFGDRIRVINEVSFARLLGTENPVEGPPSLLALGGVDYDTEGGGPEIALGQSAPIEAGYSSRFHNGTSATLGESRNGTSLDIPATRVAESMRFEPLPRARREVEAAANLFAKAFELNPSLLTNSSPSKAALFRSAPGKRYLHIATHGWFAPETVSSFLDAPSNEKPFSYMGIDERIVGLAPMTLCGLALAGANRGRDSLGRVPGILTAEELCALDLSDCELAVLSACETNVGIRRAGQGIQSLQAALYAAGARSSITSLWKVDDEATQRLMGYFYRNLWIRGMGKADALWEAKIAMRERNYPVKDWAGWVLTGNPD